MTSAEKEQLRDQIADRLVDMESMFDKRCKLTFVMRAPHLPDGDLIVTSDDVGSVIAALQRLATYEPVTHPAYQGVDLAAERRQQESAGYYANALDVVADSLKTVKPEDFDARREKLVAVILRAADVLRDRRPQEWQPIETAAPPGAADSTPEST
jgi:hypothetical protein